MSLIYANAYRDLRHQIEWNENYNMQYQNDAKSTASTKNMNRVKQKTKSGQFSYLPLYMCNLL